MLKKAMQHAALWKTGLSSGQIIAVLLVFQFTAIGAWLTLLGCRWWNRRSLSY